MMLKKHIKNIFSITISVLLLGVLFGCGKKESEPGWYYIDTSGKKISKKFGDIHDQAGSFDEYGIAMVKKKQSDDKYKVYFINRNFDTIGNRLFDQFMVLQGVYEDHEIFITGSDGVIEFLDENMNVISSIPYDMEGVTNISTIIRIPGPNGLFPVKDSKSDLWGYMSIDGEKVIEAKYRIASPFTEDGVAVVRTQDKLDGAIDENGEFVLNPQYYSLSSFYSGRALAERNKGEGAQLIDLTGQVVTDKIFVYESYPDGLKLFFDGLMKVEDYETGLSGYIDIDGNYVVEPKYESAGQYTNGYAKVKKNGVWGIINRKGNEVIPCQYAEVGNVSEEGLVEIDVVKDNETSNPFENLRGFYSVDKNCWVIEPQYYDVTEFNNGCASVIENQ